MLTRAFMTGLSDRHFTDAAQEIVRQIPIRAAERGLFHFDDATAVALALWTLIRWERKVGLVALEKMGTNLHALADQLDARLMQLANEHRIVARDGAAYFTDSGTPVVFDWTTSLERLLKRAESEAQQLRHDYVGTEHLLLGVIASADAELSRIIEGHRVTFDRSRDVILDLLGSRQ